MTGIDGYDWSLFGGNPIPGDPDAVRSIASRFSDLADNVSQQNSLVRSVGSDSESIWVGPAADKFRPHVGKLPGQLDKLTTSYRDAADALNAYWPKLRSAQEMAVSALAKAKAAHGAILSAQSQVQSASASASSAAASYNSAATALAANASPSPADTSHVKALQASYQGAQSQVAAANSALAAGQAQMAAAQQMKDTAVAHAHAASSCCAAALHSASAAGIQNPHHSWLSGIFDTIGSGLSGAWHWTEHTVSQGLKEAEPVLADVSAGLGIATAVLAVASLVLAPFGVGEALELVNEGLMGLKAADDGLLMAAGDKAAGGLLAEDALALGTGGLGRVFADGGETLAAAGEASEAGSRLAESGEAVTAAERGLSSATADVASASARANSAAADASLLRGLQSDAMAEGRTVDAVSFGSQATMKEGEQAAAEAEVTLAKQGVLQAQSSVVDANTEAATAGKESEAALAKQAYANKYSPFSSPAAPARSFFGINNAEKAAALAEKPSSYLDQFNTMNGLSGNAAQRFAQYYWHSLIGGPTAIGRLGGALKSVSIGLSVNEGVAGGQHLAAAASGGG